MTIVESLIETKLIKASRVRSGKKIKSDPNKKFYSGVNILITPTELLKCGIIDDLKELEDNEIYVKLEFQNGKITVRRSEKGG